MKIQERFMQSKGKKDCRNHINPKSNNKSYLYGYSKQVHQQERRYSELPF